MSQGFITIELPDDEGVLYIQSTDMEIAEEKSSDFFREASSKGKDITISADELGKHFRPLKFISSSLLGTLRAAKENQPDEITIETSVNFSKGGNIILMKANVEATFKITLSWKKDK